MSLKQLIERYPLLTYFGLTYGLAWGGILLIVWTFTSSADDASTARVAIVGLPMLLAPGLAGIALTAVIEGRAGLRALGSRLGHWRVPARWYALALALLPTVLLAILSVLALVVSPNFAPVFSLLGLAGLAAGFLEEMGWTGFATPRLLARWSPLKVGLGLGLVWGLWHGLADYVIRGSPLGAFWPVTFGLFVLPLTAWRVLMVWVYAHTRSGLVAQLMHFSYTGSLMMFVPLARISYTQDALIYAALTATLWAGVALLAFYQRRTQRASPVLPWRTESV